MILATKPDLKIIDKNRLQISRQPRLASWLLLFLSVIVFFEIFRRSTGSVFFTIVSLLGEIMFGLDTLGEWEDLILDKVQNKVVIARYNWSDKLISRCPKNFETRIKLSDIRHVGASVNMGLFFVCRDGETTTLDTRGLSRDEIQNHRKQINYFLNMSKIQFLNERGLDPYERIVATSDSEDESPQFPQLHDCQSNALENEESLKIITQSDRSIAEEKYLLQEASSTPSLEQIQKKHQDYSQQPNFKRCRYTENSIVERLATRSKHICDLDRPGR